MRSSRGLLGTLALVVALWPGGGFTQTRLDSESTPLQMEKKSRRLIVHPTPSAEAIARDADRAAEEFAAKRRQDELARELTGPSRRRPDLDPAVSRALHERSVERARRR